MIRHFGLFLMGCLCTCMVQAQELFVFTEPASNMATHSIGLRLNNTLYHMDVPGTSAYAYQLEPEIMWGASRRLMVHLAGYFSSMDQSGFQAHGGSLYAKYRFYAHDKVHRHFRMAAFGRAALVSSFPFLGSPPHYSDEIDLSGVNSGFQAGLVGTQLIHKLALSGSLAYTQRWDQAPTEHGIPGQSVSALNYTASAGWLLLPKHYISYQQTNINLMCELLGASALDKSASYLDVAPAIQFIFHSISRLDLGYRTQVAGGMDRWSKSQVFVRLEWNFLNAY